MIIPKAVSSLWAFQFALLIFLFAMPVYAVDTLTVTSPDPLLEDWRWTEFNQHNGLAGRNHGMYEDHHGNMWFATDRGAQKYDGLQWTTYTKEDGLAHDRVLSIIQARDGVMWIGTGTVDSTGSNASAAITRLVEASGLGEKQVTTQMFEGWRGVSSLLEAADGSIWANLLGTAEDDIHDLRRFVNGKWETMDQPAQTAGPIVQDRNGAIWVAESRSDGLFRLDGLNWTRFDAKNGLTGASSTGNFPSIDKKGNVWVGHQSGGISRFDGGVWKHDSTSPGTWIWHGDDGRMWVGGVSSGYLSLYRNGQWIHYAQKDLPRLSGRVYGLCARDGSLWLTSLGNLNKVFRIAFTSMVQVYEHADSLQVGPEGSDGAMWFYKQASAVRLKDGMWLAYGPRDGFLDGRVSAMGCAIDGSIWATGLHQGKGAVARYRLGKWDVFTELDGVIDTPSGLMFTRDGNIWVWGSHKEQAAVCYFHPDKGNDRHWVQETSALTGWQVNNSYEASDGTLWFGTGVSRDDPNSGNLGMGLYRYDGTNWMRFGEEDGFRTIGAWARISSLDGRISGYAEWPTGTLWVGAGLGLYRIDLAGLPDKRTFWQRSWREFEIPFPKFSDLTPVDDMLWFHPTHLRGAGAVRYDGETWEVLKYEDGLPNDGIKRLFRTADGAVWFLGVSGLGRFEARPNRPGSGWTRFPEAWLPASPLMGVTASKDGSFWLNAGKGVAQVRYLEMPSPETYLEQAPENVAADGNILLRFSGRMLWDASPVEDLTYAWRLDGGAWTETRNTIVSLMGLNAGSHRFEVRASEPNLRTDPTPAVHAFVVEVPWWKNPWVLGSGFMLTFLTCLQTGRLIQRDRRLQQSNAALSDANKKLFQVNVDLESANTEIQQQSERKSAFLASMSHELRTPMNAIKGFTSLVLRREKTLSERGHENLQKVGQASDHLMALINDLLDLSKIEAGRMDVNPTQFRVQNLITYCVSTVSPLVKDGVKLSYEIAEDVGEAHTDEARLRQMVINLLSNAIKFTDVGEVRVTAKTDDGQWTMDDGKGEGEVSGKRQAASGKGEGDDGSQMLVIEVSDTGKGIPAQELATIFDEYRQVRGSESSVQKGTGLGLSITKKFAELLGGTISVDSEMGKGSAFTVRISTIYQEQLK